MKKLPDLSKFDEISDNDDDFKNVMIGIFKKEFPLEKQTFLDAFEGKNYESSAEAVHKLKHKINLLNLEGDYRLAAVFEEQLRNNSYELYDAFIETLEKIEKFIKKI
ncbi:Hpt domain-containing protein [Tenacibaculum sp. 190524A02b]|uniref:Hpt domain-containing protein n=1 Tax=Tenacibaculum vairaonense TaxID=3137860 RepID=A0ABP1FAL3_9FLAO